MGTTKDTARLIRAVLLLAAGGILLPAFSVFGAAPVFDKPGFTYHPGVKKCAGCHPESVKGYRVARPVDAVCYRCHARKDTKKFVHGPMGSGDCIACHDPHGSPNRTLLVSRPESLCVTCHDQKSSEAHFRKSRGKTCTACHDPHSSSRPFLQK